ncbi:flagellar biosynthetic protein FliO [Estrella lausannensis]|uniref:Flagellar protein n=1 Tax=Estrella lausannensis TaxID=483423 RepID=A0A0H5DPN9_9BACT|nr:flagellar biosynthetic protein FliO [Estrella lausannensis]CRX38427.1 putative membrane protein [Estrella lausannensis]
MDNKIAQGKLLPNLFFTVLLRPAVIRGLLLIFTCAFAQTVFAEDAIPSAEKKIESGETLKQAESTQQQELLPPLAEEPVPETNFYREFLNMLITLGFLLVLLVGLSWFLKRMNLSRIQMSNQGSSIKILDQRSISQKSALFVVEYAGKKHLLAESATGITLISSDHLPHEESEAVERKKFSDIPL